MRGEGGRGENWQADVVDKSLLGGGGGSRFTMFYVKSFWRLKSFE